MSPHMKRDWTIVTHARDMKWKGKRFGFGATGEASGDHNKFSFKWTNKGYVNSGVKIFTETGYRSSRKNVSLVIMRKPLWMMVATRACLFSYCTRQTKRIHFLQPDCTCHTVWNRILAEIFQNFPKSVFWQMLLIDLQVIISSDNLSQLHDWALTT